MKAPEFPTYLEWFNVRHPLTLKGQHGKVVLLDFWTYCCINCMHVLPDLHYLENKYPDTLTVIGIHSPKFPNEKVAKQLTLAIQRYDIKHPVAHDPSFSMWQEYGVHAWPTLVLIDTRGEIVGAISGEGHRQRLDQLIQHEVNRAKLNATLTPRLINSEPLILNQQTLKFPGKILAVQERVYISDSGHQQIIEADWHGQVLQKYGSGITGSKDGNLTEAMFNNPQGLIKNHQDLYVADTDNHLIRKIDLLSGAVATIAGTGQQGRFGYWHTQSPAEVALNSPWDLTIKDDLLFIAMAGSHQLWSLHLVNQQIGAWAGSGHEALIDGSPANAAFAQPSGLTLANQYLYTADSEVSAIRQTDLNYGITKTLVGTGLFDFGFKDGIGHTAQLQHPLGITYDDHRHVLWIADTYNHAIRCYDLATRQVSTLPLAEQLNEPGGISYCNNTLWIANTNLHNVIKYDLNTQRAVKLFS